MEKRLIIGGIVLALVTGVTCGIVANATAEDYSWHEGAVTEQTKRLDKLVVDYYMVCLSGLQAIKRHNALMEALATEQEQIAERGEAEGKFRGNQRNRALIYRSAIADTTQFVCEKPEGVEIPPMPGMD